MVSLTGAVLLHFVWQGLAIALALAICLGFTRRATARYALGCLAMAAMAFAPAATFLSLGSEAASAGGGREILTEDLFLAASDAVPGGGWLHALVWVWAAGVSLLSCRLVGGLLRLRRWRREASPASPQWDERLRSLAERLRVGRDVSLLVSDRLQVPSAWGVVRPVVVLPASLLLHAPVEQVEAILLHELAHVRRHDYLVNLLQSVVETVLFYHPAVWWVSSVVRREREHCCDDVVVQTLNDPLPYARALLHLAERRQLAPLPSLSVHGSPLMKRIHRILNPEVTSSRVSPFWPSLAALAVVGGVLGFTYRAEAQAPGQATTAPLKETRMLEEVRRAKAALTVEAKAPAKKSKKVKKVAIAVTPAAGPTTRGVAAIAEPPLQTVAVAPVKKVQGRPWKAVDVVTGVPLGGETRAVSVDVAMPAPAADVVPAAGQPAMALVEQLIDLDQATMRFTTDISDMPFTEAVRVIARKAKRSVVIRAGEYLPVTTVLSEVPFEQALEAMCKAGAATFKYEGDVIYVSSKISPSIVD